MHAYRHLILPIIGPREMGTSSIGYFRVPWIYRLQLRSAENTTGTASCTLKLRFSSVSSIVMNKNSVILDVSRTSSAAVVGRRESVVERNILGLVERILNTSSSSRYNTTSLWWVGCHTPSVVWRAAVGRARAENDEQRQNTLSQALQFIGATTSLDSCLAADLGCLYICFRRNLVDSWLFFNVKFVFGS